MSRNQEKKAPFAEVADGTRRLAGYGCPDCPGVLTVREEGAKGHLNYACRIGHGYSGSSLIQAKERQLEDGLWNTITLLEELIALHEDVLGANEEAPLLQGRERIAQAKAHLAAIRQVVEKTRPAGD